MQQLEKVQQELRTALAADLGDALVLLRQRLGPSPRVSDIVLQSGRYHQADSDFRKGLMQIGERNTVFNQVCNALLELVGELSESDLVQPASDPVLAQKMGFQVAPQQFLAPLFAKLRVDWRKISHVHLVNCDRIDENRLFRSTYRKRHNQHQGSQFFFINACPMQRPESFAERVILEILEKYDEEDQQAILVRRKPQSERLLIEELPFDPMGLDESKRLTAKYFQKRFGFQEHIEPVEDFLRACARHAGVGKRFATFIFRINAADWEPLLTDYLRWLMDTLRPIESTEGAAEFLFFFPVQVRNLHDAPPASLRMAIEEINKLVQAAQLAATESPEPTQAVVYDMITPLLPVPMEEVTTWFEELDEADAAKVAELLLLTLQRDKAALTRLQRYMDEGIIDMYDMEALQADLYEYALK